MDFPKCWFAFEVYLKQTVITQLVSPVSLTKTLNNNSTHLRHSMWQQ